MRGSAARLRAASGETVKRALPIHRWPSRNRGTSPGRDDRQRFGWSKYAGRVLILGLDTATAMSTVAITASGFDEAGRTGVRVERSVVVGNRHAETTPGQVREVLSEAGVRPDQLDLVAVGVGPGPYTSLRVGIALARALALAVDVPVVGYCTLDVIAVQVAADWLDSGSSGRSGRSSDEAANEEAAAFGVATDARRSEIYWARYGVDGARLGGPLVGSPASVLDHDGTPRVWAGDGFDRFGELAQERQLRLLPQRYPSAATLIDQVRMLVPAGPEWPAPQTDSASGTVPPGPADLDDQSGDGANTRVPVRQLLPPLPLYLRRPDAQPPKGMQPQLGRQPDPLPSDASPVSLRPMCAGDLPAVIKIERDVFPTEPWSIETLRAELAGVPDRRYYLVAEVGGQVVGYGGLSWAGGPDRPGAVGPNRASTLCDVSDIQTVAVASDMRTRGTGRALLARLLAHSDALGYASCMLEVRADNAPAIALYESVGFEHLTVRRRYYRDGTDALIMRRTR